MEPLSYNVSCSPVACAVATCELVAGALWLAGQLPSSMPILDAWLCRFAEASAAPGHRSAILRRTATRHCAQLAEGMRLLLGGLHGLLCSRNPVYVCVVLGASVRRPRWTLLIDLSRGRHPCIAVVDRGVARSDAEDTGTDTEGAHSHRVPTLLPAPRDHKAADLFRAPPESPRPLPSVTPALLDAVRRKALRHLVSQADALIGARGAPGFDVPQFSFTDDGPVDGPAPSVQLPLPGSEATAAAAPLPTRMHVYVLVEDNAGESAGAPDRGSARHFHDAPPSERSAFTEPASQTAAAATAPMQDATAWLHTIASHTVPPRHGGPGGATSSHREPYFQHRHGFSLPASRRAGGRRSGGAPVSAWSNPTLRVLWGDDAGAIDPSAVPLGRPSDSAVIRGSGDGAAWAGAARALVVSSACSEPGHAGVPGERRQLAWLSWTGRLHGFAGALPALPQAGAL